MSADPAPAPERSLWLIQLTDSHLFGTPDATLLGMDTAESLRQVVTQVAACHPRIDLLLASGDLSQDGSVASYQRFAELTRPLQAPARWYPGNHDEADVLQALCADDARRDTVVDLGSWRLILLDSSQAGQVAGHLDASQLTLLEQALQGADGRPVLLSFHHHPLPVGCAWLDPIGLNNAEALFAITDQYPNLKAMLFGHVHQEVDLWRQGVRLLASPSTCVQFAPNSVDFAIDERLPGYRWLRLDADGQLHTGVERLAHFAWQPDLQRGY